MLLLYNLGIRLYSVFIQLAYLNSFKAKAFINGRKDIFRRIKAEIHPGSSHIWFHFASLGEFEQGRPVLEKLREDLPDSRILITFFSPSGYEIRKNYPLADHVFYLPLDTQQNAERFIELINPSMAIFTKYEYWYHYFNELKKRQIPLYVISAVFRINQPFFKWYGSLHRQMLTCVTYFFVQNQESKVLLETLKISNVVVSGDTRFDRVIQNALSSKELNAVSEFCKDRKTFIAGSTWPQDEKLFIAVSPELLNWKFIIVPHEISEDKLDSLERKLKGKSIRYSQLVSKTNTIDMRMIDTLIIDNIGMLSSLYQYGDIAYIGGGFGAGIHNTLEAAAFGLPVIFGPNYQKFKEASDLIGLGAAHSIKNLNELSITLEKLKEENFRLLSGKKAKDYVEVNAGATALILNYILHQQKSKNN